MKQQELVRHTSMSVAAQIVYWHFLYEKRQYALQAVLASITGQISIACLLTNHFSSDLSLLFTLHQIWLLVCEEYN